MPKGKSCDTINEVAESFRPYVTEIWKNLNFGLCRSKVEFEKFKNSSGVKGELADQFTLVLPYAGSYIRWEVLFDSMAPWFAPDFRFDDDYFLTNANADYIEQNIPSLAKWDFEDSKALSSVINELTILYREHQQKLLAEDENSRAYFEYTALIGDSSTHENDVEIYVGRGESVNLMIKLNVDISQLPALFADDFYENPGGESAVLLVKYPNPSIAELIMSPLVTRAVGDILLPIIHQTAVLMDYVPMVTKLINKKISMTLQNEKLRQEMLSHFIVKYEGAVLEHDSCNASFLLEVRSFYCILHIEIGIHFPEKPPTLTLRSVYHSQKAKPRFKILSLCPYDRIEEYITNQIEIFKEECTNISLDEKL